VSEPILDRCTFQKSSDGSSTLNCRPRHRAHTLFELLIQPSVRISAIRVQEHRYHHAWSAFEDVADEAFERLARRCMGSRDQARSAGVPQGAKCITRAANDHSVVDA
jgi:hypothetical protein